jgi:hypothetical protein
VAAVVDAIVIRKLWALRASDKMEPAATESIYEPNLFIIVIVVALLMMLLHALTITEFNEAFDGFSAGLQTLRAPR